MIDLLIDLRDDYWALNAIYLFKAFLPVLEEMNEKKANKRRTRTIPGRNPLGHSF